MKPLDPILRSWFTCNEQGNVLSVLRDDLGMFPERPQHISFSDLFAPEDVKPAREFWRALLEQATVFAWEIPVSTQSFYGNATFSGIRGSGDISIIVSDKVPGLSPAATAPALNDIHVSGTGSSSLDSNFPHVAARGIDSITQTKELVSLRRKVEEQTFLIESLSKTLETKDRTFQILSQAINDAIRDWNIVEDTIQWNQRLSAIYGYAESQFPKTLEAWAANIYPDDRSEAMSSLRKTIANGSSNWKSLYRYRSPNGTYKYTFDRGFVVYVGDQAVRMISVMQDIDERMTSLQEIETLSLVASKTDNLVVITDDQERIEWVNEGFIKRTGYTLSEVIGKTPRFMQGPETDRAALNNIRRQMDLQQSVTEEILNYTKDGREFWVKVNINPVFDDANKLKKYVAVETDVTALKDYENKLSSIATDLTNLIATVNAPVFGVDAKGCINEWNNLAADLTGYGKHEVLGMHLIDTMVALNSQPDVLESLSPVFNGEPVSNLELPISSKSGKKLIILINATPRKNSENEVTSIFLVGQDITELTEYRQLLEEKVKERTEDLEAALIKEKELVSVKTRFTSMVSHEFRTPLSTIKLSANHVKRYRSRLRPDEIDAKLDVIQEQVLHMTHMLEDVLAIGKSDAGRIEVNRTKLNIRDFLFSVKAQVEEQFKRSHSIHCSLKISQPEIASDADLLRNIFVNLLSNAIKFSPGKSDVYLNAFERESTIVFEVVDEGIGILQDDAERIFNPFDRGTNATSIPGTGLGLSIVKKAIELMEGTITFRSTSQGTTFTISFPKAEL